MRFLALCIAACALAGCALRPRYAQFVTPETTGPVRLQVLDKKSGAPISGATIEVGESRGRFSAKTNAEGVFTLPVDKKLMDENALIVISAPAGFGRTELIAAPVPETANAAPVLMQPATEIEVVDAGS